MKRQSNLLMMLLLAACNSAQPVPTPVRAPTTGSSSGPAAASTSSGASAVVAPGKTTSTVPINIDERTLTSFGLDTSSLTYHMTFLTADQSGQLAFANGASQITLANLPAQQSGTLTLDVLQNNVIQLRGVSANLTLTPGSMTISLTLQPYSATATATPTPPPTTTTAPPTTTALSYAASVAPIFAARCAPCHYTLSYQPNLVSQPSAADMDAAIASVTGTSRTMPQGAAPLSDAEIGVLNAWRSGGMLP